MPDTFLNKVAGLRPATLLKKSLLQTVGLAKFIRTPPVTASVGLRLCIR